MDDMDIGIGGQDRAKVANALAGVLADTYTLYLKTHNFHWNVTGPDFGQLHTLFETQYGELAAAVDEVAERIRALGVPAPGSYQQFAALTKVKEETGVPKAAEMIRQLAADNELVSRRAEEVRAVAAEAGDEASVDLMIQRIQTHQKTAWMLRAHLA